MPQIKVGDYLFKRLNQLGIKSIFGVPGDYELALLDLVSGNDLEWKGSPNELVASYAADGYARLKGAAAFVTTFGPGELSAYCGMAGHYCEYIPAVHIVGYPSNSAVKAKAIMHHSLGDGRFDMYEEMAKKITVATVVLRDVSTAVQDIDKALATMFQESRPVYIGVPTDVAYAPVSDEGLNTPIPRALPANDQAIEAKVVKTIRSLLERAANPVIVVDGGAARFEYLKESQELVSVANLPYFVTSMGKGGVNEVTPYFGGVYGGGSSIPEVRKAVESSDAILWIGRFPSDFNTGEFTVQVNESAVVDFQRTFLSVGGQKINVALKYILQALVKSFKQTPLPTASAGVTWKPYSFEGSTTGQLTQDFLWETLGQFFQPGDVIIGETGTSAFGLGQSKLPNDCFMFNQTVFGSIGYATGAAVGAFQAIKETSKYKRGVLVTGEGSLHLTIQAFADLLRFDLKPIIFVLNNDGYTIERLIHGPTAEYNEVAVWDYGSLAKVFGPKFPSKYHGPIRTAEELKKLIEGQDLKADCFHLVEVVLDKLDTPRCLRSTAAAIDEFNKAK